MASNDDGPAGPEQLELFDNDLVEVHPPKHPVASYKDAFPGIEDPLMVEATACTLGEYLEKCNLPLTILDDPEEPGYLIVLSRDENDGESTATVDWMPEWEFEQQFEKVSVTLH